MSGAPSADRMLPYGRHQIEADDIDAVRAVLAGDWLTTGPAVERFESAFAAATAAPHAVVCSNGTAALHLAAMAGDLGPDDVAVVPTVTFLATANAVRYTGAEVIFADVDPDCGLLTPATLAAALDAAGTRRVRAVFPVHLAGQCVDTAGVGELARARGALVIEDACHAIGGEYRPGAGAGPVGSCAASDMATFSLHPVKTITMGEGGVVTTRSAELAQRMRRLRNHGMSRDPAQFVQPHEARDADGTDNPWYYEMAEPGYNYRATDMQCALGLSQLSKLARFVARRRALAARYDAALADLAPLVRPLARVGAAAPAWHLYVVLVDFDAAGTTRARVMNALRERGIGTQVHYLPVHRQPYYRARYGEQRLPGADAYYRRCLSVPLYPGMEDGDVDRVVDALRAVLGR